MLHQLLFWTNQISAFSSSSNSIGRYIFLPSRGITRCHDGLILRNVQNTYPEEMISARRRAVQQLQAWRTGCSRRTTRRAWATWPCRTARPGSRCGWPNCCGGGFVDETYRLLKYETGMEDKLVKTFVDKSLHKTMAHLLADGEAKMDRYLCIKVRAYGKENKTYFYGFRHAIKCEQWTGHACMILRSNSISALTWCDLDSCLCSCALSVVF